MAYSNKARFKSACVAFGRFIKEHIQDRYPEGELISRLAPALERLYPCSLDLDLYLKLFDAPYEVPDELLEPLRDSIGLALSCSALRRSDGPREVLAA